MRRGFTRCKVAYLSCFARDLWLKDIFVIGRALAQLFVFNRGVAKLGTLGIVFADCCPELLRPRLVRPVIKAPAY